MQVQSAAVMLRMYQAFCFKSVNTKKVKTHIGKFMSAEKQRAENILYLKVEETEPWE